MGLFGLICYMQTMTLSCRLINCIQFMLFRNKKNKILLKTSYVIRPQKVQEYMYTKFSPVLRLTVSYLYIQFMKGYTNIIQSTSDNTRAWSYLLHIFFYKCSALNSRTLLFQWRNRQCVSSWHTYFAK